MQSVACDEVVLGRGLVVGPARGKHVELVSCDVFAFRRGRGEKNGLGLMMKRKEKKKRLGRLGRVYCVHLLAAVDEALLHGRDALLLLDLFLDLGHLQRRGALFSHPSSSFCFVR